MLISEIIATIVFFIWLFAYVYILTTIGDIRSLIKDVELTTHKKVEFY
jgi:hypothetical protein